MHPYGTTRPPRNHHATTRTILASAVRDAQRGAAHWHGTTQCGMKRRGAAQRGTVRRGSTQRGTMAQCTCTCTCTLSLYFPRRTIALMADTGDSGPVVVDGESFLDALFASAGQG